MSSCPTGVIWAAYNHVISLLYIVLNELGPNEVHNIENTYFVRMFKV